MTKLSCKEQAGVRLSPAPPTKKLLFSVTMKDLIMQTFTSGGNGGQNQNRRNTGVRLIHPPSGARGEARDSRNQGINKRSAFERLIATKEFKGWHKMEVARRCGILDAVEREVDRQMQPENLKIEYGGFC